MFSLDKIDGIIQNTLDNINFLNNILNNSFGFAWDWQLILVGPDL